MMNTTFIAGAIALIATIIFIVVIVILTSKKKTTANTTNPTIPPVTAPNANATVPKSNQYGLREPAN